MIHHRVHWVTRFAMGSLSGLNEAISATHNLSKVFRIGETGLEAGRFSLPVLTSGLSYLRELSSIRAEVYRLDFRAHNYVEMIRYLREDEDSYTHLPDVHTYFTQGYFEENIFAPESLNVIFLSHLLSTSPVREPAPDTFIPSLSTDEAFLARRKQDVFNDFQLRLNKRHEELITNGRLVFDVFGELKEAKSMFDLLNHTIKTCMDRGIVSETFKQRGIIPHFWSYDDIMSNIDKLSQKFTVHSYQHHDMSMPHYEDFLVDKDKQKYAEFINKYWRRVLRQELNNFLNGNATMDDVYEVLLELTLKNPPAVSIGSHHFVLIKR